MKLIDVKSQDLSFSISSLRISDLQVPFWPTIIPLLQHVAKNACVEKDKLIVGAMMKQLWFRSYGAGRRWWTKFNEWMNEQQLLYKKTYLQRLRNLYYVKLIDYLYLRSDRFALSQQPDRAQAGLQWYSQLLAHAL